MKELIKTREEIEKQLGHTCTVVNMVASGIKIKLIGHFNNTPEVSIVAKESDGVAGVFFPALGGGAFALGFILRGIAEVLNLTEEDGMDITELKDFPMRVITDAEDGRIPWGSTIIGFGHLVKDRFVLTDELNRYVFTLPQINKEKPCEI